MSKKFHWTKVKNIILEKGGAEKYNYFGKYPFNDDVHFFFYTNIKLNSIWTKKTIYLQIQSGNFYLTF